MLLTFLLFLLLTESLEVLLMALAFPLTMGLEPSSFPSGPIFPVLQGERNLDPITCSRFLDLEQSLPTFNWFTMPPQGFPCGSAGKESTCNVGDLGLIPGLGRSPGEGKGDPLQYSGLENSIDCIVYGVTKSWTQLATFTCLHRVYIYIMWLKIVD